MLKKVFIRTFRCQMNEYDSARMRNLLEARTGALQEADLIIFNTCSAREKAQEKVFSDLGRIKN